MTNTPKKPGPQVEHDTHEERIARLEKAVMLGDPTSAAKFIKSRGDK